MATLNLLSKFATATTNTTANTYAQTVLTAAQTIADGCGRRKIVCEGPGATEILAGYTDFLTQDRVPVAGLVVLYVANVGAVDFTVQFGSAVLPIDPDHYQPIYLPPGSVMPPHFYNPTGNNGPRDIRFQFASASGLQWLAIAGWNV